MSTRHTNHRTRGVSGGRRRVTGVTGQLFLGSDGSRIDEINGTRNVQAASGYDVTGREFIGSRDNIVTSTNTKQRIVTEGSQAQAVGMKCDNSSEVTNNITGGTFDVLAKRRGKATGVEGPVTMNITDAIITVIAGEN